MSNRCSHVEELSSMPKEMIKDWPVMPWAVRANISIIKYVGMHPWTKYVLLGVMAACLAAIGYLFMIVLTSMYCIDCVVAAVMLIGVLCFALGVLSLLYLKYLK